MRGGEAPVTMGHASGLVTINVSEADPAEITRRQENLGEPFRTVIGHFRHEFAHHFFEQLAEDAAFAEAFRVRFGAERADYGEALRRYYEGGPPKVWAETAAHLPHLTDMADSAEAAGLAMGDQPPWGWDAYAEPDAVRLVGLAAGLGLAFNQANRSMGLDDLYPFVLPHLMREKLGFAHAHPSAGPAS